MKLLKDPFDRSTRFAPVYGPPRKHEEIPGIPYKFHRPVELSIQIQIDLILNSVQTV